MERYIIGDTEASGLITATAEMYSFGGFILEVNDNGRIELAKAKAIHRFFNTDKPVPAESFQVHGLSNEFLTKASNGDYLEDCYEELNDYFYDETAIFTGYNVNFDKGIISSNLIRNGLKPPKWKATFDVMQEQKFLLRGTGYDNARGIKLIKAKYLILEKRFGLSPEKIKNVFYALCKNNGIECVEATFHSALWDSYITMLILYEILLNKRK